MKYKTQWQPKKSRLKSVGHLSQEARNLFTNDKCYEDYLKTLMQVNDDTH